MKTIVLNLKGPLQSYGIHSQFNERRTESKPQKSAIIGIIAASLGYKRDDPRIKDLKDIKIEVETIKKPHLLRDFQVAKNKKTSYLISKYYLEDGNFRVKVIINDDNFAKEIYNALKNPVFQPFMGRKSCPLPYDFLEDIE